MTEFQYRVWNAVTEDWGNWLTVQNDKYSSISVNTYGASHIKFQVRLKPAFEPGYFEAVDATHTVRWFDENPSDPIWRRVKLVQGDTSN